MRKLITVLLVLTFLVASCIIDIKPSHASEGSWETKTQMRLAKTGFGVGVVNGKIYVLGGHPIDDSAQYTIDHTSEYDPTMDQWESKHHMLGSLAWFGTAVYENEIYVIGGAWFMRGSEKDVVWVYNPTIDTWISKASMPTARASVQANVVDGKIYVIGGEAAAGVLDVNEVYDPSTDMWTIKTPIPTPVSAYASAVVDGKIYVIGGLALVENSTAKTRVNLNQIYDPKMDTWSFGAPMPNIAKSISAGATSGVLAAERIYVVGDGLNQVYNPSNDSWTMNEPLPNSGNRLTNFGDVEVVVVNDQLYALGGVYEGEDGKGYSVNEQYTPIGYGTPDPSYTPSTPTPEPEPFPTTLVIISVGLAVVGLGIIAFFKKYRK